MARLACSIEPGRSLDEAVGRVRAAESLGYESVWVSHIAAREPFQLLGHYAHHTERIGLGTAVVPIFLRHPALTAMEAATLDETSGGRLRLGLGVSHKVTVEGWYGLSLDDPVGRMREYLTIVRGILEGGSTAVEGKHYTARFGFMGYGPRPGVPILIAALRPRMLRLAAELADGIALWMCSPAYIRDTVRPTVEKVLAEKGRSMDDFSIFAAVPVGLTENVEGARDAFRQRAFPYLQLPFYRAAVKATGHGEMLAAFDEASASGDMSATLRAIPDQFVDEYAGVGDAETVRGKVEDYREAGASLPSVGPITRHEGAAGVEATLEAAIG